MKKTDEAVSLRQSAEIFGGGLRGPMTKDIDFQWIPGVGPRQSAIGNLRRHFGKRPSAAPGEAWFMSKERRFFTEFLDKAMTDVEDGKIKEFLFDMTSGLGSFPEARDEIRIWIGWFKYMLVFLVERGHERSLDFLFEMAVTTFIRIYGDAPEQEYPDFRQDALMTLGQVLMKPEFWDEQGECVAASHDGWLNRSGELHKDIFCSGAISSSIFFCLLYLPAGSVDRWTHSLLRINSVYFRAHFLVWLVAVFQTLDKSNSFNLGNLAKAPFEIAWDNSFLLENSNPQISKECMNQFLDTVRGQLTMGILSEWQLSISAVDELNEMVKRFLIFEQVAKVFDAN